MGRGTVMTNNYATYKSSEKNKTEEYLNSSVFRAEDAFLTDVGSGYLPNSQLLNVRERLTWPVSSMSDSLKNLSFMQAMYGVWPILSLEVPNVQREAPILTTKDKLEDIRVIFGLSISHLAKVLRVSRPSLHSWLEGDMEPRDQSVDRITKIYQLAKLWKDKSSFHYPPSRLMRQPLGDGPSMLERLEREVIVESEIQEGLERLIQLMRRQREQMDRSKKRRINSTHPEKEKSVTTRRLTRTISSSFE